MKKDTIGLFLPGGEILCETTECLVEESHCAVCAIYNPTAANINAADYTFGRAGITIHK